jgi:hypothetical protein
MGYPLLSGDIVTNWTGLHAFYAKLTFGSAALSTVQTREMTVARANAGSYTITLPQIYRTLVEVRWMAIDGSGGVLLPVVDTDNVATAGTLLFELRTEAGTATDPDDTTQGLLCVVVSNDPFNDNTV